MADSFLEIAPGGVIVPVSGKQIETFGLPLRSIAAILMQYPALIDLLFGDKEHREAEAAGKKTKQRNASINPIDIAQSAPEAVVDIILHGIRMPTDKKARQIAENLPSGEQLIMLSSIIKQSIGGGGLGPLVEHLEELVAMGVPLVAMANSDQQSSPQATNSPLQ